jgi:hypothetical protein
MVSRIVASKGLSILQWKGRLAWRGTVPFLSGWQFAVDVAASCEHTDVGVAGGPHNRGSTLPYYPR